MWARLVILKTRGLSVPAVGGSVESESVDPSSTPIAESASCSPVPTSQDGRPNLGAMSIERKDGQETFENTGQPVALRLSDFWAWSASDIIGNTERGVLAEFIVGAAIGADGIRDGVREEWAAYDLKVGDIAVEVKSAAFIQAWEQAAYSRVSFSYAKTQKYTTDNREDGEPSRAASVYVFALLKHTDQATLNPLDMAQWEFYVVPTLVLEHRKRSQSSVTLGSLKRFCTAVTFQELRQRVDAAAAFPRPHISLDALADALDDLGCDWSEWSRDE